MDVTEMTVGADNLLAGETALKNNGDPVTGTLVISPGAPDGHSWTRVEIPMSVWGQGSTFDITDMAYGNGKYVALVNTHYYGGYGSSDPTKLLYSTDLINWTTVILSGHYDYIAFGNGTFLLLEGGGDETRANIAYSSDLVNWTYTNSNQVSSDEMTAWDGVKCTDGIFYIIDDIGENGVSTDLINWDYGGPSYIDAGASMDDGYAVFAQDGGTYIVIDRIKQTSPHTKNINTHSVEITTGRSYNGWAGTFCENGKYGAVLCESDNEGTYYRMFCTSDYGDTWTDAFLPIPSVGYDYGIYCAYGNGKYIFLCSSSNNDKSYFLISTDCVNFETFEGPFIRCIEYGGGAFFGYANNRFERDGLVIYYSRTTNDY